MHRYPTVTKRRAFDLWALFPSPADRAYESTGDKVNRFLGHLAYVYNEERDGAQMRRSNAALAAAVDAYWNELRGRKRHDFGTITVALTRLLSEDAEARAAAHDRTYLVDEAQDLNTNQLRLVERLAGPARRVLVVGDDDQQMYAWRGSDPVSLRKTLERLGAAAYTLPVNWRSTRAIVEPAACLIARNERRFPKDVRARDIPGLPGEVTVHRCASEAEERDHVVRAIRGAVGSTIQRPADPPGRLHTIGFGDVLVLVRRRSEEALALVAHLHGQGILDLSVKLWHKWDGEPPKVHDTEARFTIPLGDVTIVEGRSDALLELHGCPGLWNVDLKTRNIPRAMARVGNPDLAWDVLTQQVYHLGLRDVTRQSHRLSLAGSQLYFARPDVHVDIPTGEADLRGAKERVLALVDGIRAGRIEPRPGRQCRICDYNLVCQHCREPDEAEGAAEVRGLLAG